MTGRILRIELRRSAAVGIALLLLVISTALLLSFPQGFAGRWTQLAVSARTLLIVSWPLALAGGAWLGMRDARSRVDELFASTVRPRWQRVLPTAGAAAITVLTAYVLVFLVGAAWVVPTAGYFPVDALVLTAVGGLALIAALWLGMAAGRAVPRVITAPALAVVAAALVGLLPEWVLTASYGGSLTDDPDGSPVLLLSPVFSGSLDDFQTIAGRVNLIQALWLAALAATGLLLLGAVGRRAIALAMLPALSGAAVAVPLLPAGGYPGAATVAPAAVGMVCDDNGAQVCVTRVHAGLLPDVVGPTRQALAMLAAKLPDAPVRAEETQRVAFWARPTEDRSSAPPRHQADTLVFEAPSIGPTGRADFGGESLLPVLLEAAWRQECADGSDDSDAYLARMMAAAWVTGQPPRAEDWWGPTDRERVDRSYRTLVGLPQAEQRRRMVEARAAALDCRPDALRTILPAGTP